MNTKIDKSTFHKIALCPRMGRGGIEINFYYIREDKEESFRLMYRQNTEFSCGVHLIDMVNSIPMKYLDSVLLWMKNHLYCIETNFGVMGGAMLLFSVSHVQKAQAEALERVCEYSTPWTLNPNSGNSIKVFTMLLNNRRNDITDKEEFTYTG